MVVVENVEHRKARDSNLPLQTKREETYIHTLRQTPATAAASEMGHPHPKRHPHPPYRYINAPLLKTLKLHNFCFLF